MAEQFFDAAEAIEERIAVQVHGAGGFAEVAVVAKEVLERADGVDAAACIGIE